MMPSSTFWYGRRVLLTGHTGFKGAWASLWLERLGADVTGYALAPDQRPALFNALAPFANLRSVIADLADHERLLDLVSDFRPQIILHMAAQPLVRRSYREPRATFAANVQGTVNLLDAAKETTGLEAVLVVTTDKVYAPSEERWPFQEDDRLGGLDPYSASKAATEIAVRSYAASFFTPRCVPVATARAGNVVGGGDWSEDRLVPDIWRAMKAGRTLNLRYPNATRPWQHVLEAIAGYLGYVQALVDRPEATPRALNFGPALDAPRVPVAQVAETLARELGMSRPWSQALGEHPHEADALTLDASAAMSSLGWKQRLDAAETLRWTAQWYSAFDAGEDARTLSLAQLQQYEELA